MRDCPKKWQNFLNNRFFSCKYFLAESFGCDLLLVPDIENYPGSQHRSRSGVAFDDSTTCDIPMPSASDALSEHEKLLLVIIHYYS